MTFRSPKNGYFEYLCGIVGLKDEYRGVLESLYDIDFYSLVPNDDNRGADGLRLRQIFQDEEGKIDTFMLENKPCSVLEMLIALCYRLELEVLQSEWEKTPSEWFWILIDNLNLTDFSDKFYEQHHIWEVVSHRIDDLLSRTYGTDGDGGLFPLKNPKKDQRRVEIWYQMSAYILENYPV